MELFVFGGIIIIIIIIFHLVFYYIAGESFCFGLLKFDFFFFLADVI